MVIGITHLILCKRFNRKSHGRFKRPSPCVRRTVKSKSRQKVGYIEHRRFKRSSPCVRRNVGLKLSKRWDRLNT